MQTEPPVAVPHMAYASCNFAYDREVPEHHATAFGVEQALPVSLHKAVPKRQAEYLAGRVCARQAMGQLNGPLTEVHSGTDRAPQWPAGYVGSITHNDTSAAAIIGSTRHFAGLGIDQEEIMAPDLAQKLQNAILSPVEAALQPQAISFAVFTSLAFSAKEALYKATYPLIGQMFGFHDVSLQRITATHLHFFMQAETLPDWQLAVHYVLHPKSCETLLALPASWPHSGGQNASD
ncbi:MAG: 4'-phosphopantetheinyl transferase superfamily protein [Rhodobacteraceae bacterium]|nr:4'-phosphopantetheinyl transferase superfamily protein [Paracoccaceae bacterium]